MSEAKLYDGLGRGRRFYYPPTEAGGVTGVCAEAVARELNNLLTIIQGNLENLESKMATERLEGAAELLLQAKSAAATGRGLALRLQKTALDSMRRFNTGYRVRRRLNPRDESNIWKTTQYL